MGKYFDVRRGETVYHIKRIDYNKKVPGLRSWYNKGHVKELPDTMPEVKRMIKEMYNFESGTYLITMYRNPLQGRMQISSSQPMNL